MKDAVRSIVCAYILYMGYALCIPHIGYSAPQPEEIAMPSSFYSHINSIESHDRSLVFYTKIPISAPMRALVQKACAGSSFVKSIRYTQKSVEFVIPISFGYVVDPQSSILTLFYDSTAQRMRKVQKINQSNVSRTSAQKARKHNAQDPYALLNERITLVTSAGPENDLKERQQSPVPIVTPTRQSPAQQMQIVRPRTTVNDMNETQGKAEAKRGESQNTGKQRINLGGPQQWGESTPSISERNVPRETPKPPVPPQPSLPESEIPSQHNKESENRQNVRARITPPSASPALEVQKQQLAEQQHIPNTAVSPVENVAMEMPQPASENTALLQEEEKKKGASDVVAQQRIAEAMLNRGEYEKALTLLKSLVGKKMSKSEKESLLYLIADISEVISRTKKEFIPEAINNFNVAMNFNLASENVPDALLQLGLLNGSEHNTKEIEAYFSIIRNKYPKNKNVPLTYYYLGKYYQDNKQYSKALVQYKILEEQYPQFEYLREVIVAIIQCLDALQYYDDIKPYIAFIDGRWPTLYQVYPDILLAKAKVHFDLQEYKTALDSYWQYVNIVPKAKDIDMIYSKIGDSYLHLGEVEKARSIYKNIIDKYKNTEGYVLAKIRLAEDTVIDDVQDDAQFLSVFDKSYSTIPRDTYMEIIQKHKNSAFVPIAQVKLAMWYFWMKEYNNALRTADDFRKANPDSPLMPSVYMLIGRALNAISEDEKMRGDIPALWGKYKGLFTQDESLLPEYRLHIAQALADDGAYKEAIDILHPFFKGRRYQGSSEQAIVLALNIYKKLEDWKGIEELYYRVLDWDLSRNTYAHVVFDTALAFETMGEYDKADTLFNRIFASVFTSPYYKGVSAYYIAKNGLRSLKAPSKVYPYAQESLNSLLLASKEQGDSIPKEVINADIVRSLIQLRDISTKLEAHEDVLRYTLLQEQYEPNNLLLQIEKAKTLKQMGKVDEWKRILEEIIKKEPSSSYAKLARSELVNEENKKSLREL